MRISVTSNVRDVMRDLDDFAQNQVPFALSRAINTTLDRVQEEIREELEENFTIRRKQWARNSIKRGRGDFASKTKPQGAVRLESPGGGKHSDILGKFEEGGTKRPRDGRHLAIPDQARRGKTGIVAKSARPKAFNFRPEGTSGRLMEGDKRTFMIRNQDGTGGIYQRTGRGKRTGVRRLFGLTGSVRIERRLKFFHTAEHVIRTEFNEIFSEALDQAIRTGRPPRRRR